MLASDVIICYLATLMHNEPKEDGFQGQLACGLVVRNRVIAGWEGADWVTLIRNHDKYAAYPPHIPPRALAFGDPIRDDKFRRTLGMATNIYGGMEKDITFGALRYGRLDQCTEEFAEKIVRPKNPDGLQLHPRVAQIGLQSFFK